MKSFIVYQVALPLPCCWIFEDFRFDAELGDLYGYEQKDIMAYGFANLLERTIGDVCYYDPSSPDGNWPLVIKDWDFVEKFYRNAVCKELCM